MTSLHVTQNIIITVTLLATIALYLSLEHQLHQQNKPTWSVTKTSPFTNITLQVTGLCRPLVYCGVDSRTHLLSDYDAHGKTAPSAKYSPSHINWARILLIRTVLAQCPPHVTKWVFYSDTDAYFESRYQLWNRLNRAHHRYTLLFQHGQWLVNSGVEAWRNNNDSLGMLEEWEIQFDPNSTDFFDEQNALDKVFSKHVSKAVNYPNGYLAWHIKGRIPYKTDLAAIGRRFAARSGPALLGTVLITIGFFATVLVVMSSSLDESSCTTTPIHFRPLYLLATSYRRCYHKLTSSTAYLTFLTLMAMIALIFLAPTGKKLSAKEFSRWDYYHLFPNGRLMLRQRTGLFTPKVWVDAYWHSQYGGLRYRLFDSHVKSKWKLFTGFVLAEVIEWSKIIWIYPVLLVVRHCNAVAFVSQYSKYTLSAVLISVMAIVCVSIAMEWYVAF